MFFALPMEVAKTGTFAYEREEFSGFRSISRRFDGQSPIPVLPVSVRFGCLIRFFLVFCSCKLPDSVVRRLPKKNFSSTIPCGVCMYFQFVTREIVLSCSSSVSAISRNTSGLTDLAPSEKNGCFGRSIADERAADREWAQGAVLGIAVSVSCAPVFTAGSFLPGRPAGQIHP